MMRNYKAPKAPQLPQTFLHLRRAFIEFPLVAQVKIIINQWRSGIEKSEQLR
jgi:hypothetical protein